MRDLYTTDWGLENVQTSANSEWICLKKYTYSLMNVTFPQEAISGFRWTWQKWLWQGDHGMAFNLSINLSLKQYLFHE